jgi:hypothetical protein
MRWQFWLLDLPAKIVDIWLRMYTVLLAIAGILSVGVILLLIVQVVLEFGFGIRWGW